MEKRNIGEVITMFLVEGYLDEDDIIPVLKKGTAKMMGEKEEKIFTQPLQKESEWEKEFDEKWPHQASVMFEMENIKDFIKEAIKEALVNGYEDGYKIGHWEGFEGGRNFGLKEREKEISVNDAEKDTSWEDSLQEKIKENTFVTF